MSFDLRDYSSGGRQRYRRLWMARAFGVLAMLGGIALLGIAALTGARALTGEEERPLSVAQASAQSGAVLVAGALRAQPVVIAPDDPQPLVRGSVQVTASQLRRGEVRELLAWSGDAQSAELVDATGAIPVEVSALGPVRDSRARASLESEPGRGGRVLAVRYGAMRFPMDPPVHGLSTHVERHTVPAERPVVLRGVMSNGRLVAPAGGTITVLLGTPEQVAAGRVTVAWLFACLGPLVILAGLITVVLTTLRLRAGV